MSYDVHLEIDTGGPEPSRVGDLDENYTYNVAKMFRAAADLSPNDWNGRSAEDVARDCERILEAFERDPTQFIAMNPENGWGNFGGASQFIRRIREACLLNPKATVVVS